LNVEQRERAMSYNRDTEWMNAAITTIKGIAAKRALSLAKLNILSFEMNIS